MKVLQGKLNLGGYVHWDGPERRWQQPVTIDISPERLGTGAWSSQA